MCSDSSRRDFLKNAAGFSAASFFIGGCLSNSPRRFAANEKVNLAIIGCGRIARTGDGPEFLKDSRCRITVVCDMVKLAPDCFYGARKSSFGSHGLAKTDGPYRNDQCGSAVMKELVDRTYGNHDCREVFDWREVIDDPTIDAVAICTPDHWHAIIAIAAMRKGKHVHCQKPVSLTVREGRLMAQVAKETGVTFQVGNQGASNPDRRLSEEIALNGYAGKVKSCTICIPAFDHWEGHGRSAARLPLPRHFSREAWDLWQGPARHWEDDAYIPSIHQPTCWRFNDRYGGGMIPDFGAHEFDQLQRGLGMQLSGPVAVENVKSNWATGTDREVFSWPSEFEFDFVYANGVRCHVRKIAGDEWPRQTIFHCEKGDVGYYGYKFKVPECLKNFKESDLTDRDVKLYRPRAGHDGMHGADFIDGVLLGSQEVASPCEVGHRTITLAHIANICIRLQHERLAWDPEKEVFTGPFSESANQLLETTYHNGWKLT